MSTTHKYKGRESECIILLDVDDRHYPLMHPHWAFGRVFQDTLADIVEAERRLLYVALTRATDRLYVLTESTRPSPFLSDLQGTDETPTWELLGWKAFPPAVDDRPRVIISGDGTYQARAHLKEQGFRWNPQGKYWHRAAADGGTDPLHLQSEQGTQALDGVEVLFTGPSTRYWVSGGTWTAMGETRDGAAMTRPARYNLLGAS